MFLCINAAETEVHAFKTFDEAYGFVTGQGEQSPLWWIVATSAKTSAGCTDLATAGKSDTQINSNVEQNP